MSPQGDSIAGGDVFEAGRGLISTTGSTEEPAARLEERFRAIFDQMAVGIVQITLDGRLLEVNPGFCRMVGYGPAELLGKSIYDLSHPDDRVTMADQTRRLLGGELASARQEKRYIHKDGTVVWVDRTASLVRDAAGKPRFLVGIIQDITSRKRNELWLQFLANLPESADPLADADATLDHIVRGVATHFRVERCFFGEVEPATGCVTLLRGCLPGGAAWTDARHLDELCTPAVCQGLAAGDAVVIDDLAQDPRTRAATFLLRSERATGAALLVACVRDGRCVACLGIAQDTPRSWEPEEVTRLQAVATRVWLALENARLVRSMRGEIEERRVAEEALRRNEERYRLALQHSSTTIFEQDLGLRYVWINNPGLGFDPDMVPGNTDVDLFGAETARPLLEVKRRILDTGVATRLIIEIRHNDQARYFDQVLRPVRDAAGTVVGLLSAATDITSLKQTEAELRQLNEELEGRVAQRTADLQASKERLGAILTTAPDAIITTDHGGIIRSFNPAAERIFGYEAGAVLGRHVSVLTPATYRHLTGREVQRLLRLRGGHGKARELLGRRQDGSAFPMEVVVGEARDSDGRFFTAILRDISRRKQLEREVLEIAALEQQRIGQELHDGVGQELTGLGLMAGALLRRQQECCAAEVSLTGRLVQGLARVHDQVRALSRGLVPVQLDAEGLRAALEDLASRTTEESGVPCSFDCPGPVPIGDSVTATHLFRIAQEAVSNALRHGHPAHIYLALYQGPEILTLSIRDDGIGLPAAAEEGRGVGLRIMRYRAEVIGAALHIGPAEGGGTQVTCTLPGRKPS